MIEGNEVTWGVLRAALLALYHYIASDKDYKLTECDFDV